MKIAVMNCSNPLPELLKFESDTYVDFRSGRSSCFSEEKCLKHCRSWHSWPYALETEFFVYLKPGWEGIYKYDGIILLVNREMDKLIPLVKKLKLMKKKVAIAFHEGGQDLIGGSGLQQEDLPRRWIGLTELVKESDFYLTFINQLMPFFRGWFGEEKVKYCNHTAPFNWEYRHALIKPQSERRYDILVGTRTLAQRLSRNTLISLGVLNGLSKKYGWSVHYLSEDGDTSSLFKKMGLENINLHLGPLPWEKWIEFLSNFKCMVHADNSLNLGQIALDGMMVNVACYGSTTSNAIDLANDDGADYTRWEEEIKYLLQNGDPKIKKLLPEFDEDETKDRLMGLFI